MEAVECNALWLKCSELKINEDQMLSIVGVNDIQEKIADTKKQNAINV